MKSHELPEIQSLVYGINPQLPQFIYKVGTRIGGQNGGYITQIVRDDTKFSTLKRYEWFVYASKVEGDVANQYLAACPLEMPSTYNFFTPDTEHNKKFV